MVVFPCLCFTDLLAQRNWNWKLKLLQGVNFIRICEGIAAINFNDYQQRIEGFIYSSSAQALPKMLDLNEQFYANELYSFPSNYKLTDICLPEFQRKQSIYENKLTKCAQGTTVISRDHTVKISKFLGASRGCDKTFVKQFQNLFIVLNDRREVISWRLTRTTAFEEIKDLLEHIRDLIGKPGVTLSINDCCKVRALYQSVFLGVKVKLDLFHGVQRVTRSIPKGTEFAKRFSKEFGQIFRSNGDLGDRRTLPTPHPKILDKNLNNYLKRWKHTLEDNNLVKTHTEIGNLRKQKNNGCLLDIKPEEGTEYNESLHHTLNNSLVSGVTTIGPELIVALLSLLFYGINSKRKGKNHVGNSSVIPFIPILNMDEDVQREGKMSMPYFKSDTTEKIAVDRVWNANSTSDDQKENGNVTSNDIVIIEDIVDMFNKTVSALLLRQTLEMHNILDSINNDCNDWSIERI